MSASFFTHKTVNNLKPKSKSSKRKRKGFHAGGMTQATPSADMDINPTNFSPATNMETGMPYQLDQAQMKAMFEAANAARLRQAQLQQPAPPPRMVGSQPVKRKPRRPIGPVRRRRRALPAPRRRALPAPRRRRFGFGRR